MFLNLTPTPKIAPKNSPKEPKKNPKGPKKVQKRSQMWENYKQKDRAVLPKPKLIVYFGRSQKKFLNLTPTPKIAPKGPKSAQKSPKFGQSKNKKGLHFQNKN